MENTDTLEENVKNRTSNMAELNRFSEEHIKPEASGNRSFGIFKLPDRTEYQLGTARKVMEYFFNTNGISRATIYEGINEEALHKIADRIAMADSYGDAAQIANWEFLKESEQYRSLGNYID